MPNSINSQTCPHSSDYISVYKRVSASQAAWLVEVVRLSCSKITGWMECGGLSFFAPPLFLRCRPLRSLPLCSDSLISGQQQELNRARRRTPPPRLPRAGHSCTPCKKRRHRDDVTKPVRELKPSREDEKKNRQNGSERLRAMR